MKPLKTMLRLVPTDKRCLNTVERVCSLCLGQTY
jgi:hypothetical protein